MIPDKRNTNGRPQRPYVVARVRRRVGVALLLLALARVLLPSCERSREPAREPPPPQPLARFPPELGAFRLAPAQHDGARLALGICVLVLARLRGAALAALDGSDACEAGADGLPPAFCFAVELGDAAVPFIDEHGAWDEVAASHAASDSDSEAAYQE